MEQTISYTVLESTSLDDDWEKDFDDDVEVTEEDRRLAAEAARKLAESGAIVDDGDVSTILCWLDKKYA